MSALQEARLRFAEDVRRCAKVQTAALLEALATVPREAFLPPGPWAVRGGGAADMTPDADPRHLYQDVSVAIDEGRQLFNGAPSAVLPALDALCVTTGDRVFHVGCGLGYYTALLAHVVGRTGRVRAVEIDEAMARHARANLVRYESVTVEQGDGAGPIDESFDAILIHAGVTQPLDVWLDAIPVGGRVVLPITTTLPGLAHVSKGVMVGLTKANDQQFDVRPLGFTMIYTAVGLRDEALNAAIGGALLRGFADQVTQLRRDAHPPDATCLLHGPTCCFRT